MAEPEDLEQAAREKEDERRELERQADLERARLADEAGNLDYEAGLLEDQAREKRRVAAEKRSQSRGNTGLLF